MGFFSNKNNDRAGFGIINNISSLTGTTFTYLRGPDTDDSLGKALSSVVRGLGYGVLESNNDRIGLAPLLLMAGYGVEADQLLKEFLRMEGVDKPLLSDDPLLVLFLRRRTKLSITHSFELLRAERRKLPQISGFSAYYLHDPSLSLIGVSKKQASSFLSSLGIIIKGSFEGSIGVDGLFEKNFPFLTDRLLLMALRSFLKGNDRKVLNKIIISYANTELSFSDRETLFEKATALFQNHHFIALSPRIISFLRAKGFKASSLAEFLDDL